jgi:hypothetical protein
MRLKARTKTFTCDCSVPNPLLLTQKKQIATARGPEYHSWIGGTAWGLPLHNAAQKVIAVNNNSIVCIY